MPRAVLVTVPADLPAVEDTLRSLAPRWTMWITSTLLFTDHPLRRGELDERLPFIPAATMSLRLSHLRGLGITERPGGGHLAPIQLTDRGRALSDFYLTLNTWAGQHLGIGRTANGERVENALHRLALTDTTTVLRLLTDHGRMRNIDVAEQIGQSEAVTASRLRRMQADGLVDRTGPDRGDPYTLSSAARALPPVYAAAHEWANFRPGQPRPRPQSQRSAATLTSTVPVVARTGRSVPGVRFSDLASAPAASYADGASRAGTVRR